MFEQRGVEFLIIAGIALIVVGPKELPGLLRKLGQFVGKMRNIANDFRTSFDEMARQSELDDLRKQVEEMRSQAVEAATLPHHPEIDKAFEDFQTSLNPPIEPLAWDAQPPADPVSETAADKPKAKRAAPKPQMKSIKPATAKPAKASAPKTASKPSPAKAPAGRVSAPKSAAKPAAEVPAKPRRSAASDNAS